MAAAVTTIPFPPPSEVGVGPITHAPTSASTGEPTLSPEGFEDLLGDWFGAEVVLMASGRTALERVLRLYGFERYTHTVAVPPFLARCVVNAVTRRAFPVAAREPADGVLLYDQYGFRQRTVQHARSGPVVEDIAHRFFHTASTGRRGWAGDVGIFSLPKFFPLPGPAGGVVTPDAELAGALRAELAKAPTAPEDVAMWMGAFIAGAYTERLSAEDRRYVASAYELLFAFPRLDPRSLAGLPDTLEALQEVGRQRLRRVEYFRATLGHTLPDGFIGDDETVIPFALPYFPQGPDIDGLRAVERELEALGVCSGIYHVDTARDMADPEYRPCLLLPCHQDIPMDRFRELCVTVDNLLD